MLLIASLFVAFSLNSQDIHWTQYHNSPVNLNPALTAVFNGDTRFVGHYRSQWNTVPVNYLSFSGAVDTKFFMPRLKNSLFGLGLIINHDEAGWSYMRSNQIGLSGGYTHQLAEKHFLTLGLQGTISQREFDYTDLTFDNQWNGDIFDAALPTREPNADTRIGFADFAIGLNWHIQNPRKRHKLDIGGALYHINTSERSFDNYGNAVEIPRKINLYAMGAVGIGERFDLLPRFYAAFQMPHSELVPSLALRYHINTTPTKETAIEFGLAYRFADAGDAIAPMIEFHHVRWHIGLNYDINISDFSHATNGFGAPEMSIQYIITKVRPGEFKICPIF